MGTSYVWITGLLCDLGHDILPQSSVRDDYLGYPRGEVPIEVAEDLRDNPFNCMRCDPCGPPIYRLRFTGEPRSVCEGCGSQSTCGCYKVVSVEVEPADAEVRP